MIFDELNCPKDSGASDWQDSARLAGLMTLFNYPHSVELTAYIEVKKVGDYYPWLTISKYVRHPVEKKYDFSLDQAYCLMAGLSRRRRELCRADFVVGKDWKNPKFMGFVNACQKNPVTLFQKFCLLLAILFHAYFAPKSEPNQLLSHLRVMPRKWIQLYCHLNKQWREGLREYWYEGAGAWRNEKELCEWIIKDIEEKDLKDSPSLWSLIFGLRA